jgi:arsenate reductase (thioredoxin)
VSPLPPNVVLFVCVQNAGRSLMAEAIFNADPPSGWVAESAGTEPANAPNPRTAPLLAEIGLRLPNHPPRLLSTAMIDAAQLWVTMGCVDRRSCPADLRRAGSEDWALDDPGVLDGDGFRRVRDEIVRRVARLKDGLRIHDGRPVGADRDLSP